MKAKGLTAEFRQAVGKVALIVNPPMVKISYSSTP